ncbi:hypothetical protein F4780DRAFT_522817 [Xylariomycetidae sp. FL0641]|nr:hypothetical protein F4780DRAFT_522817 [Xylariomycetidae sp. FL0641]
MTSPYTRTSNPGDSTGTNQATNARSSAEATHLLPTGVASAAQGYKPNGLITPTVSSHPSTMEGSNGAEGRKTETMVSNKTVYQRPSLWTSSWWWWDLGASIVSLVAVGLIIVVLQRVDDHDIEAWPYSIRPNSMVAVLTTITKTSMMVPIASCLSQLKWDHFHYRSNPLDHLQIYDDASRGPWGALLLIVTGRLRVLTAWALALVTLIALGIEPSAQQMLEPLSRQAPLTNATAQMGRASNYTSKAIWSGSTQGYGGPRDPNPDLLILQTTIANGAVGSVQEANFHCPEPASKCIWGNFSTLAVCASYNNLTDSVDRDCRSYKYNDTCTFSFPINETIKMTRDTTGQGGSTLFNAFHVLNSTGGDIYQGIIYGVNDSDRYSNTPFSSFDAFSITLNYCVRDYQKILATPAGLQESKYTTSSLLPYNWTNAALNGDPLPGTFMTYDTLFVDGSTELYNVSVSVRSGLFDYVTRLLSGKLTSPLSSETTAVDFSFGEFMYSTDLRNMTKNIEDTLTNQIRSTSPGDNRDALLVPGQAFYKQTYWHVHWPWIIVSVVEVLLTLLLLLVSMAFTRHQPLYKSSSLALLFHPFRGSEEHNPGYQAQGSSSKLEKLAKGMDVEFKRDEDGAFKFIQTGTG